MLAGKRIFISGGAGVIGRELVEKLHAQGAVLFVGDLKPRPAGWPDDVRYRQGDLNYIAREELEEFAPEYFFHLAATFERSTETYEFWQENYQHNLCLSHYLMDCLKDSASLKKVVFPSSYLIYNPELYNFNQPQSQPVRLSETDPVYPRNLCGCAKFNHEIELRFLSEFGRGYQTVCARIYRSYGKNSRDVISRWIRALLKDETLTVYKPEGMFDYIYAGDVAEGLIRLAVSDATGIVNLGRDRARRVADVLTVLKRYFPNMQTTTGDLDIPYEASQANMDKFRSLSGWAPSRNLEDTIPEMIEYEKIHPYAETDTANRGNILITSISRKVPMIRAIRAANDKLGLGGRMIGADTNAHCVGQHFCDDFWLMPPLEQLTIADLLAACRQWDIRCIIPSRDGELAFFAAYQQQLTEHGIAVMISPAETITMCLDKLQFAQLLQTLRFPVIPTVMDIDDLNDCAFYVVKERYGAGARNIGLRLNYELACLHAQHMEDPVFQPYIDGQEYSVDIYVDRGHRIKGTVVRHRDQVVNGESQVTTTLRHEAIEQLSASLVETLGLYGHVVLQLLEDKQGIHIIECNSRFGGASTCSLAAGLDSFYWFLLEAAGVDIAGYPFVRSQTEKRLVRYPADQII